MINILVKFTKARANVCKLDDYNYLLVTEGGANLEDLISRLRLPHHAGRLIISTDPDAELMQAHFQATKVNWNSYQVAQIDDVLYQEIAGLLREIKKEMLTNVD